MYYLLRLIIELCLVYFGSVRKEIMPCRKNIRENVTPKIESYQLAALIILLITYVFTENV